MRRVAIIGGGAAGFFAAINLKEKLPHFGITIFESGKNVLRKVKISGGGRCNCTNSFAQVTDLSQVYPRGHQLMKRLLKGFSHVDTYRWFETHHVPLITQTDGCVFPRSQDSHTIINMFLHEARQKGIEIKTDHKIDSLEQLQNFDSVIVATGGISNIEGFKWLDHEIITPIPSLFAFNIEVQALQSLMGIVIDHVSVAIPGTKMRADGPLLITHWGMSGPAILRLSSYAARLLAESNYHLPLSVNWLGLKDHQVFEEINSIIVNHPQKQIKSIRPCMLKQRLWEYIVIKTLGEHRSDYKWAELSKKEINRLANSLTNDTYNIAGRSVYKDEFVTCGGISLNAVSSSTLESKTHPNLYFVGEVLDVDGVTGGFNFQAAWTTAYTVVEAIQHKFQNV